MAIIAFQPPDRVKISNQGFVDFRWSRFFDQMNQNLNNVVGDSRTDIQNKTGYYQLLESDAGARVDATSGIVTITLPDATNVKGYAYFVNKVDASSNYVTVNTLLSQTINGDSTSIIQFQNSTAVYKSDGSNWFIT